MNFMKGECMGALEDGYKEIANAYLRDVKMIAIRIKSLRQDIRVLRYDIITLSAIDYSKERISGGGTPSGLENDVARLVDTVSEKEQEIAQLIKQRETARHVVDLIRCIPGRIILTQEYINGLSKTKIKELIHYEKSQYFELKNKALIELGEQIKQRTKSD